MELPQHMKQMRLSGSFPKGNMDNVQFIITWESTEKIYNLRNKYTLGPSFSVAFSRFSPGGFRRSTHPKSMEKEP